MQTPTRSQPASISIFFPAYNDGATIASLVLRAVDVATRLTPDFEVIIVNDGSSDATREIADELTRTYPQVRAVHHPHNRGYGGALRTGFASATKGTYICWLTEWQCLPLDRAAITMLATRHVHEV